MSRKKDPNRSIRLPDEPHNGDDLGAAAVQDLAAHAKVRSRDQLPKKVKVITPQVIANIVQDVTQNITQRFGEQVNADEFNQLVAEQTEMQMVLQQTQERLAQYQTEYKKLYEAYQKAAAIADQLKSGELSGDQVDQSIVQQYEDQIAELQQRNANAVDTYMSLQQQLDETLASYDEMQVQLRSLETSLKERDAKVDDLERKVAEAHVASSEAGTEEATARASELEQQLAAAADEVETLRGQIQELQERLDSEQSAPQEGLQAELESLREAEGRWLEEKRLLANQLSNETSNRAAAEERLKALEEGKELPAAAKLIEAKLAEAGKRIEALEGELKAAAERHAGLEKQLEDSGSAAKELAALKRRFEGVEGELEQLRAAEGKWLEDKRRLAHQLSNETNLRRELEKKFEEANAAAEGGKKNS
jgi:chromosome segregation ATPase